MKRTVVLPVALIAAGLTLSACAGSSKTTPSSSGSSHSMSGTGSPSASPNSTTGMAGHNSADISFAQLMVPHHRQALEMAKLAGSRASSTEVKQLAAKIQAAQQPEIDTMTRWLTSWHQSVPMGEMMGQGMSGGSGMMTHDEMSQLMGASGPDFDRMFLTMMISHHTGAIAMANDEVRRGQDSAAQGLAGKMAADQTDEIAQMQRMLAG